MDKNEEVFVNYLNMRWQKLYKDLVVDTSPNNFISELDINRGKNKKAVENYLNSILQKALNYRENNTASIDAKPFHNDNNPLSDTEIYFAVNKIVNQRDPETKTYMPTPKEERNGYFSSLKKNELGVKDMMNDDDNVKKVVQWLNDQWKTKYLSVPLSTKAEADKNITWGALRKKVMFDVDLTPEELKTLQYHENNAYNNTIKANPNTPE